ncbi:MAG: hypothetical protein NVSMB52_16990 [Chloroflexota bacterium]
MKLNFALLGSYIIAGLVIGSLIVFIGPRLVAYRLLEPDEKPPLKVLIPLIGVWLSNWRVTRTIVIELGVACIFLGLALRYGSSVKLPIAATYCTILVTVAYIDVDYRLVLNRLSYPGIVIALAASWWWPAIGVRGAGLGALVALLFFGGLQIVGRGALGTGDTKLAVMIGAMRGFPGGLSALILGIILGGVGTAFYLFILRRRRRDYIPYAPYLSAGAVLTFFLISP